MTRTISVPLVSAILAFGVVANAGNASVAAPDNPAQGKRLFLRCASCHAIDGSSAGKIGPTLQNVVGRKAGGVPGYGYSPAMKAANFGWDEATLDRWLTRPSSVVPGTSMAFAGLPKPEDRKAVIDYLKAAAK